MLSKLVTEFVGTFFLVLTVGFTALMGAAAAPVAIAAVLLAMTYMGGPISGAHYNPAVTLAVWIRGATPGRHVLPYVGVQVAAALLAALVVYVVNNEPLRVGPAEETGPFEFFLLELAFAYALVLTILHVGTSRETAGNDYFGLAIAAVMLAGASVAGPISGGAFNPAVALGSILVDLAVGDGETLGGLWLYLLSTFAGGALAALTYRLQRPGEFRVEAAEDGDRGRAPSGDADGSHPRTGAAERRRDGMP